MHTLFKNPVDWEGGGVVICGEVLCVGGARRGRGYMW